MWLVEKDRRWTEARIRDVPHSHEMRSIVGGDGRDAELMQSTVYRPDESAELATMSAGTLDNFRGRGWQLWPLGRTRLSGAATSRIDARSTATRQPGRH